MKPHQRPAVTPPVDDKADQPMHVEAWAPLLLQALMRTGGVLEKLSPQEQIWLGWAKNRRLAAGDYGPLLGAGSWNHSHMFMACLVWIPGESANAVEWFHGLLQYQLGKEVPPEGQEILRFFGGTETHSCEYETFRFGAYNAVAIWCRSHAHPLAQEVIALVSTYNATLARVLELSATEWVDEEQFRNKRGDLWYSGAMISPVGERSAVNWYQCDLHPFFTYNRGVGGFVSERESWPMAMAREAALNKGVSIPLSEVKLWAPMRWLRWEEGSVATWKDSRQNGNTACLFGTFANARDRSMTTLYPWEEGRQGARHSEGAGSCSLDLTGRPRLVASAADEVSAELPVESPLSYFVGDQYGIRPEALPY